MTPPATGYYNPKLVHLVRHTSVLCLRLGGKRDTGWTYDGGLALALVIRSDRVTISTVRAGVVVMVRRVVAVACAVVLALVSVGVVSSVPAAAVETFSATGSLGTARYEATASVLSNGKILIAGGYGSSGALASAELYDPAAGTFTATGSLGTARYQATASVLSNGKVLIAGGINSSAVLTSAELYDPVAGTFTATGPLGTARDQATASVLSDGKVLIAGGYGSSGALASAELYDPPNQSVTFQGNGADNGSMANQAANVPTALSTNTFTRTGYTFAGWNTVAGGGGIAYANSATYPFSAGETLYAQWSALPTPPTPPPTPGPGNDQTPVGACVKSGGALPRSGVKTLIAPGCATNADQMVGVSVRNVQARLSTRGDVRFYRLVCQTTSQAKRGKVSTTINTGHGSACRRGSLKIRTLGHKLKLTVVWKAPATGTYNAYKKTRTYTT